MPDATPRPNSRERNLEHSRPLDIHRWSDHPEAKRFVTLIWDAYFKEHFSYSGRGKRPKAEPKAQFKVLLLDLYVAWKTDPELLIAVPMAASSYKAGSRYNTLHISKVMSDIVHRAHEVKLIDMKLGSEAAQKTTRIWPTELLLEEFRKAKFGLVDVGHCHEVELIVLRKDGKQVEYEDTDNSLIPQMREDVRAYNDLLSRTFVDIPTLDNPVIERATIKKGKEQVRRVQIGQHNKLVRRVFYRGSWLLGGRFHGGWWQQIKSDWRKQIYINDEPTVEQDYSGLHVNLLYGLKEHNAVKDPYAISLELDMEPREQRKCVKGLVLMAINAKTEEKAYQAFRSDQPKGATAKTLTNKDLKQVLDGFRDRNPEIAEDLCKDKGVELMAIDGRITASVMNHFTKKHIPILSIHDSYITSYEHTGLLRTQMNEATKNELNGFEINIEQEGIGVDQVRTFSNMDRANDYSDMYKSIKTYERTEGYINRLTQFHHSVKKTG